MATIDRFENLECWKSSQELLVVVFDILSKDVVSREFSFQHQLKRATISISNNIAEGFERKSAKEKLRFLEYSIGSVSEVKSMLYGALNLKFIDQSEFETTFAICEKCGAQIKGLMKYLNRLK